MIPHVTIDEDRQILIVAVPYYPSFIQDLKMRGLHGIFIKEKKHYEFGLELLPEVVSCLNHNFSKINQSPSVALSSLLTYLDEEDLLNVYRILARRYKTGVVKLLLDKTFGPFIHIEREIVASKPRRRIEMDEDSSIAEVIEDPSLAFAEIVRNLEEDTLLFRQTRPRGAREIRNDIERVRQEREPPSLNPVRRDPYRGR